MTALADTDRQQIIAIVRRADELASARDVDGYLALTTADMLLDGSQGTASGRAEVREAIQSIWAAEPQGTRHVASEISVVFVDDATAQAHSTLSLAAAAVDSAPLRVWAVASIAQLLRKTGGVWLIARRTVGTDADRSHVGS